MIRPGVGSGGGNGRRARGSDITRGRHFKEVHMFTLLRNMPLRTLLYTQAPSLLASFFFAEFFYKFHSFTFETLAFLATWFVIDAFLTSIRGVWLKRRAA